LIRFAYNFFWRTSMKTKTKVKKKAQGQTSSIIYKWRGPAAAGGVPAQIVGETLAAMEVKPGDFHRAPDVLDAARHPDHKLHPAFEWDDGKAAELHRLNQARGILRSIAVVIVRNNERTKRPMYVHVTDEDGPRYVNSNLVATDDKLKRSGMDEALQLLNSIRKRFEFIEELGPVFAALEKITSKKQS
jgi:hypothetical protein